MYAMQRLTIALGIVFIMLSADAQQRPILIQNIHSGRAVLRQQSRLTILEFTPSGGTEKRVALTHPTDYRQGTNAPYASKLIAEYPGHFLIFVDVFASNPGNVQGKCGASPDGEQFLHVVALGTLPHETLSLLFQSCLLDIEPSDRIPKWIPKQDSAGFAGELILRSESDPDHKVVYWVDPDGAVSRPSTEPDAQ
jgi:hypothetical protein